MQKTKRADPSPENIRTMFDAIAPTYDFLNHLLSFGLDIRWRKKAIKHLQEKRSGMILDIASGSGDCSLAAMKIQPRMIVATDFAQQMLKVFQQKLNVHQGSSIIQLITCDALSLPFRNESFDGTMVAFGIRNFADKLYALNEMLRVLKPNGVSVILELTQPQTPVIAQLYSLYTQWGLPLVGKIISRHNAAYRYLPESIAIFPNQQEFLALMTKAEFVDAHACSLSFGIATIYVGRKRK